MSRFLKAALFATLAAGTAQAGPLGLGREALPEEIAVWDIDVRPDGLGLPEGSGDVATGELLFADNCAVCHGDFGEAVGRWPVLAGGEGSLTNDRPVKTVGSYWPYLSTVYDYVNRAMPFGYAQSLEADEVYAITAYLLYLNYIVDEDFELSRDTFTQVEMPNEGGFFMDDRAEVELTQFSAEPCMSGCKTEVKITARAAVIDVTPEETAAKAAEQAATQADAAAAPETEPETEVAAVDPALIEAGEKVFRKCKACHQVGEEAENGVGPHLNGVIGRAAGAVDDFRYSKPLTEMAGQGLVWTSDTMSEFLLAPRSYIKGTKMGFAGLKKENDRAAVAAYLATFD
ncbi:c-type cytochrome [Sulfitobacter sabulilitoris]|uniref:C-type cytochrome n=1 Tax=Sulfitobacter sabulilitoris TaxID=2562655 RepID=A0A5S3PFR2_9RHOB|nr:c-type cytochrome [Sulfitobacter sabulilitoris]TMM52849.1 c-type cytochrome [Sulfitobacter sabulilitoris]